MSDRSRKTDRQTVRQTICVGVKKKRGGENDNEKPIDKEREKEDMYRRREISEQKKCLQV